ncbi:MAG TPA: DEAD/DEAH box helicase [Pseudomonadales bacterium]|nr:DEAD/DEAH box helicase [Pseudomonadales bacterium]
MSQFQVTELISESAAASADSAGNEFADLGLRADIIRALNDCGYSTPTPIQKAAIPAVLTGHDLLAAAQTGTGKTAGFTLPILQKLSEFDFAKSNTKARIRALVLTPTRELAAQVEENVRDYSKYLDIKTQVVFGGVNIGQQKQRLNRRTDILVATPGRLLDLAGQKGVDLSGVEILVLDEADRMLDMGFIHDIRRILALLPKQRQNLLFSATFSDEIKTLANGILRNPVTIEVARRNSAAELVEQIIHPVDRDKKRQLLSHMINENGWYQALVFTRTKHGANRLVEQLETDGISAMAIHGNKSQGARTRALAEFKLGYVRVLVATDIAARGIDIDALPVVINYELPNVPEDYVHRIGRTGRAGAEGKAFSLVCVDEYKLLADIERLLKRKLPQVVVDGFEPDRNAKPQPLRQQRDARPAQNKTTQRKKPAGQYASKPGKEKQSERRTDEQRGQKAERHGQNKHATARHNKADQPSLSARGKTGGSEQRAKTNETRSTKQNAPRPHSSTGKTTGQWVKRQRAR